MSVNVFSALVLVASAACLYAHFRWATVDPHNPAARPGRLYLLVYSLVVSILFFAAFSQSQTPGDKWGLVLFQYLFGVVVAPAINTPYQLRRDEAPNFLMRSAEKWRVSAGGALLKTLIVLLVSWPLSFVITSHPEFYVIAVLSLWLSFAKLPVALALAGPDGESALRHAYAKSFPQGTILVSALIGVSCLAVWLAIAYPFAMQAPAVNIHTYWHVVALLLGFATLPQAFEI